jgi:hypothetical protein
MTNITKNELEVLTAIDQSCYGEWLQDDVWTWDVADSVSVSGKAFSGVVSSLVQKGLVYVGGSGEDASIGMTDAGAAAYVNAVGRTQKADYRAQEERS